MYFYLNIYVVIDKEYFLVDFVKSLCIIIKKGKKKLNKIIEGVCIVYNVYLFE